MGAAVKDQRAANTIRAAPDARIESPGHRNEEELRADPRITLFDRCWVEKQPPIGAALDQAQPDRVVDMSAFGCGRGVDRDRLVAAHRAGLGQALDRAGRRAV